MVILCDRQCHVCQHCCLVLQQQLSKHALLLLSVLLLVILHLAFCYVTGSVIVAAEGIDSVSGQVAA